MQGYTRWYVLWKLWISNKRWYVGHITFYSDKLQVLPKDVTNVAMSFWRFSVGIMYESNMEAYSRGKMLVEMSRRKTTGKSIKYWVYSCVRILHESVDGDNGPRVLITAGGGARPAQPVPASTCEEGMLKRPEIGEGRKHCDTKSSGV